MAPALSYKKNYKVSPALQLFYTGGPVVVSGDISFVACACTDDVKIVDLATGALTKTLKGDTEPITALALSPDGRSLFAASRSLQIKHWDLPSETCLRAWKAHDGPVAAMAVDASGGLLATASADRRVLVWDVDGGFCTHAFKGHTAVVNCVQFHPDIHRLLVFSGSDDGTVRVWDLVTKASAAVLDEHFSAVTSLAVSKNGWTLLTASRDKVVNVWDLRDYTLHHTVPVYEAIETVLVVPDGCGLPGSASSESAKSTANTPTKSRGGPVRFLTVGEHGIVQIWNSEGAVCLYKQRQSDATISSDKDDSKGGFIAAVMLPSQRELMCVTADQRLLFYETVLLDSGESDLKLVKRLIGYNEEIIDLRFVGAGEQTLAVATNLEQVRVYDLATMTCQIEMVGHTDIVLCLDSCISAAGVPLLASSGKDHTVRVWDASTGACLALAAGHMAAVGAIAFSKKKRDFLVSGSSDRTIKLWNLEAVLGTESSREGPTNLSSQAVVAAHDKDINAVAIAPNDSLVCSGSQDRTAKVWKLPELIPLLTLKGHKRGVWCVEFSPVDQAVLTGSGDKTIKIWALADGSCLKTFEGHTASVLRCSFLTRGTQLISAGADGLVKLWTIKTNECVNTFDHHEDKIWALAVSPETDKLATGGGDSLVNLWTDCTVDDEEEAIRQEEEEALKDQDLSNALADTDWGKAVQLAFELRRPFKLLAVFTDLLRVEDAEVRIRSILQSLGKEYRRLLLEYIRDWNAKPKSCHVAQRVLFSLISVIPAAEIVEIPGVRELMEGIVPYTKRHFSRIDRLSRSTFLLDYTLARMNVLLPEDNLPLPEPGSGTSVSGDKLLLQGSSWPSTVSESRNTEGSDKIDPGTAAAPIDDRIQDTEKGEVQGVPGVQESNGEIHEGTDKEMVEVREEMGTDSDVKVGIDGLGLGTPRKRKSKRKEALTVINVEDDIIEGFRGLEDTPVTQKKRKKSQSLQKGTLPAEQATADLKESQPESEVENFSSERLSKSVSKLGRSKRKTLVGRRKSMGVI